MSSLHFCSSNLDPRQSYRHTPGLGLAAIALAALLAGVSTGHAAPFPERPAWRALAAAHEAAQESTQQATQPAPPPADAGFARGRLLVIPRAGLPAAALQKELAAMRGRLRPHMRGLNSQIVELPLAVDEANAMQRLRNSRHFKSVELDRRVKLDATVSDPKFYNSWSLPKIGAPEAWDMSTGENIIVAILDTGVDSSHPDLAPNLVAGWNTYDGNANSEDVFGHGTSVAGVVAMAANNNLGSAGIAPRAKLMPVRISSTNGYGYISTIAQGIYWAADHGARVVNVSFGGIASSPTIQAAANYLRNKGGVVIASAGNTGVLSNIADSDALIMVGSTYNTDAISPFSTQGPFVDITAPGSSIYTTTRGGGFAAPSGTSFSSPAVAGVVALMLSVNPALTAADIDTILFDTALDLGLPGRDPVFGHGRVSADRAVAAALAKAGGTPTRDATAPRVALNGVSGTVEGIVPINVEASDNVGVVRVDLLVDGNRVSSDTSTPFAFAWDSSTFAAGTHTLMLEAFDAAGNSARSAAVMVTVAGRDTTAPSVSMSGVSAGVVSGIVAIRGDARDDTGVARVELYLNGSKVTQSTSAPYAFSWDTAPMAPGNYTLHLEALDPVGNRGRSSPVTVSVAAPDTSAPTVSLDGVSTGQNVSGTVTLTANASDNKSVARVDFYVNGVKRSSDASAPYAYGWNTDGLAPGTYSLRVEASDAAGNVGRSGTVTVTIPAPAPAPAPTPAPAPAPAPVPTPAPAPPSTGNAPVITQFLPHDGTRLGFLALVSIVATDDTGVSRIELSVDGKLLWTTYGGSLNFPILLRTYSTGRHTLTAKVIDHDGNITTQTHAFTR